MYKRVRVVTCRHAWAPCLCVYAGVGAEKQSGETENGVHACACVCHVCATDTIPLNPARMTLLWRTSATYLRASRKSPSPASRNNVSSAPMCVCLCVCVCSRSCVWSSACTDGCIRDQAATPPPSTHIPTRTRTYTHICIYPHTRNSPALTHTYAHTHYPTPSLPSQTRVRILVAMATSTPACTVLSMPARTNTCVCG